MKQLLVYGVNELKKIFKRFIMSVAICFPLVFTLMMICSIIGLSIGLGIYSFLLVASSIVFTLLYDINELKKILKRLIMSVAICFSLIFTLMIINAAMGLFIKFDFYLLLFGVLTIGFTMALVLFDSNIIFSPKKALTFIFMMINLAMGLFIKSPILTIGFTMGLVLFDSNVIFSSKKVKQPIKRKQVTNKVKKIESHSKVRRKVS